MSEENSVTWLCQRCGRRQDIELETDPVLLRVCDSCKIENWTRPVKGVVETIEEIKVPLDSGPSLDGDSKETSEVTVKVKLDTEEVDKKLEATKAKIAELNAELAELEK